MAKKKVGPRNPTGLQCTVCGHVNYVTSLNKNNDILKKQTEGSSTFPISKFCNTCRAHTSHKQMKKLK